MQDWRSKKSARVTWQSCYMCDNLGASIIRIGFGGIFVISNPQNPILIIKAPTVPLKMEYGLIAWLDSISSGHASTEVDSNSKP